MERTTDALRDPVTGLPSRLLLADRLEHAQASVRRMGGAVGLVTLELADPTMRSLSHRAAGSVDPTSLAVVLLQRVASRLSAVVRASDTLARVEDDGFAILCAPIRGATDLGVVARRATRAVAGPAHLDDVTLDLACAAGWALVLPGEPLESVLARSVPEAPALRPGTGHAVAS